MFIKKEMCGYSRWKENGDCIREARLSVYICSTVILYNNTTMNTTVHMFLVCFIFQKCNFYPLDYTPY